MIKLKTSTLTIGMVISFLVALVFSVFTGMAINNRLNSLRERTYLAVAKILTEGPYFHQNLEKVQKYIIPTSGREYSLWILDKNGVLQFSNGPTPPPEPILESLKSSPPSPKNTYREIIPSLNPFAQRYITINPEDTEFIVGFQDNRNGQILRLSSTVILSVFASCFFVYIASLVATLFYLKKKTYEIDATLKEIESGNLSARVHLSKLDRATGLIPVFNQMADKLQVVGEKLKTYEQERLQLLQELAHDIRTPLTSLRGSSEALVYAENLSNDSKLSLLKVIADESHYLEKLLADLFFLAELQAQRSSPEDVHFLQIVEEEIRKARATSKDKIFITLKPDKAFKGLLKMDPILAKRLVSNLLENALHAAEKTIQIDLQETDSLMTLKIWNDGALPSEEQILQYGKKRKVRTFNGQDFKGSLGLGTVIIRSIVDLQKGQLKLEKTESPRGFKVEIELPLA